MIQMGSMSIRIRRYDEPPRFVAAEKVRHTSYRHTLPLDGDDAEVSLRYRFSRWRSLAEDERVRKRELFAWIQVGRRRVGALELHEFEMSGCLDNDDVLDVMDCEDAFESRLAEVLCSVVDNLPSDVMPYGSILDFRHGWIAPAPAYQGLFAKAATTIIGMAFPDHALLVMKAYPLEYEGQVPNGTPVQTGLAARQRAMARYYGKIFGVQPLPDPHGKEGWLWRAHPRLEDLVAATGKAEASAFF